jgi:hypothetical protein
MGLRSLSAGGARGCGCREKRDEKKPDAGRQALQQRAMLGFAALNPNLPMPR